MKRTVEIMGLFTFLLIYFFNLVSADVVFAKNKQNYLFTPEGNSVWVLNKTTRKMMYLKLEKKDKLWKSASFVIPASYNIEHCEFQIAGKTGSAVFLFDTSSGKAAVYEVKRDHTIEKYIDISHPPNDGGYALAAKGKHAWILDRSSRKLEFIRLEAKNKFRQASPAWVPLSFDLKKCELRPVGKYGEGAFLVDPYSGMAAFYKVQRAGDQGLAIMLYADAFGESDLQ